MPGQLCVPVHPGSRPSPAPAATDTPQEVSVMKVLKKCIDLGSYTDLQDIQARKLLLCIWMPSISGLFFLSDPKTQPDFPTRHQGRA